MLAPDGAAAACAPTAEYEKNAIADASLWCLQAAAAASGVEERAGDAAGD